MVKLRKDYKENCASFLMENLLKKDSAVNLKGQNLARANFAAGGFKFT